MAYKGYKGCGPRGLGTSPIKQQTNHERLAEIKQTRENLNKETKSIGERRAEHRQPIAIPENLKNQVYGSSGALGLIGGPVARGIKAGLSIFPKLFGGFQNTRRTSQALKQFKKNMPKNADGTYNYTKTSYSGSTKPNANNNLRQDSFGGTTSTGSRRNYNNTGSN